jgi:hypothetical protein
MSTFSSGTQRQASRVYEQEVSLNHIFDDLSEGFKKLDSMNDSKKQSELKRMTGLMQEAKSYVAHQSWRMHFNTNTTMVLLLMQIDP